MTAVLLSIFVVAPITMFLSYNVWASFGTNWGRFVMAIVAILLLTGSIASGLDMMQPGIHQVRALQIVLFVFVEVLGWGMLLGIFLFARKAAA
jgi:hypothetical protein